MSLIFPYGSQDKPNTQVIIPNRLIRPEFGEIHDFYERDNMLMTEGEEALLTEDDMRGRLGAPSLSPLPIRRQSWNPFAEDYEDMDTSLEGDNDLNTIIFKLITN